MRLGQLARKLSIRPDQIVEYLQKFRITVEEGSNARVEDIHAEKVIAHFAPALSPMQVQELLGKEINPESEPEVVVEEVNVPEAPVEETLVQEPVEVITVTSEMVEAAPSEEEEEEPEAIEVIKAPKVELPGLRVVGKIELPQPKKKEEVITETSESDAQDQSVTEIKQEERTQPTRKQRNNRPSRNRDDNRERPRKNPIALQREREARQAEKKKREEEKKKKEQRAIHYAKKIKQQPAVKSITQYRDEVVEEKKQVVREEPTTTWSRFLKWFWRQ